MHRLLRTHATCALVAAASTARAQVAYDNFGPDPGFWPHSERVINGDSGLAYQFVSQASGDVTSIRVALMAQEGPSIGRLEIYSSDPLLGGPLDRLDSWTTPLSLAESNEVTQLMIDDGPTLAAGRVYWMAAFAEPGTTLVWRQTNGLDQIAGVATWVGSGWSLLGAADVPGAYSITVPAPHAGLLIVFAGSLVSRRSRRAQTVGACDPMASSSAGGPMSTRISTRSRPFPRGRQPHGGSLCLPCQLQPRQPLGL